MRAKYIIVRDDDSVDGNGKGNLHRQKSGNVIFYASQAAAEESAISLCQEYERSYFVCKTTAYVEPEKVPVYITQIGK